MEFSAELVAAERAARAAGACVLGWYRRGDVAVEAKADASPLTQADRDADAAIARVLRAAFPGDALLSEETPDHAARLGARRVWIVDPLDGTRDFVQRTDEFAIHVALAEGGAPAVGVVYLPVPDVLYAAVRGHGAWREAGGVRAPVRVSAAGAGADLGGLRVGVSRHHLSPRLAAALAAHPGVVRRPMGASTKHVAVAAGELDAVINLSGGEFEWDTCAPELIVREAGGACTDATGAPFRYNQPDPEHHRGSIASNGVCHAALVAAVAPHLADRGPA